MPPIIGWDEAYTVTRRVLMGFRTYSVGNLPASWNIVQGTNGTDVAIQTDVVNIAWAPATRTNGPQIIYNADQVNTPDWRIYGAVRAVAANQNTFIGLVQVLNAIPTAAQAIYVGVRYVGTTNIRTNVLGTLTDVSGLLTPNLWHQVGIEKAGTRLRFYANVSAVSNDITLLSGFDVMTVVYETTIPGTTGCFYPWSAFTATAVDATHYSGAGDFYFEEIQATPPTTSTPSGGPFSLVNNRYSAYKSIRAATQIYNNLVITP